MRQRPSASFTRERKCNTTQRNTGSLSKAQAKHKHIDTNRTSDCENAPNQITGSSGRIALPRWAARQCQRLRALALHQTRQGGTHFVSGDPNPRASRIIKEKNSPVCPRFAPSHFHKPIAARSTPQAPRLAPPIRSPLRSTTPTRARLASGRWKASATCATKVNG